MTEYIEREALIADIEKRYCKPCEAEGKDYNHVRCRACWVDDMVGEIEDAPAAEVAPVVHRRWTENEKRTRPVVRVDERTGDVVRFHSVKAASESVGGTSISMNLLTNRPLKGYRFYYEEDWKGGEGR